MKFVVARYYFDSLFRDEANRTFVTDLFDSTPALEGTTYSYVIGDVEAEEHKGKTFVRGTLGRLTRQEIVNVYDDKDRTFKSENLTDIADALVEFLVYPELHLIFIEDKYSIRPDAAIGKIKRLYKMVNDLSNIEIDLLFIEKDVYETIKSWDSFNKVTFKNLRPTNPSSKDAFKEVEDLLSETGSERTSIEFNTNQSEDYTTLNPDSLLIRQSLALSSNGYGDATLEGVEGGEHQKVSTQKFARTVDVDFQSEGALDTIIEASNKIQSEEDEEVG